MRLGLREANQQFARVVRAARAGRDVVLTDRGKPIAVIRSLAGPDPAARLMALAAEGLVRLPARSEALPAPRWNPIALMGESISATVSRDRDEDA
jgi:prevent-host-death family protein